MYDKLGPGSEREFIVKWLSFLIMDNFLLEWSSAAQKALMQQLVVVLVTVLSFLSNPFKWFEDFDDNVYGSHVSLDGVQGLEVGLGGGAEGGGDAQV